MMIGIKRIFLFNNIIQLLYYIGVILLLREKTSIQLQSQIREMMI